MAVVTTISRAEARTRVNVLTARRNREYDSYDSYQSYFCYKDEKLAALESKIDEIRRGLIERKIFFEDNLKNPKEMLKLTIKEALTTPKTDEERKQYKKLDMEKPELDNWVDKQANVVLKHMRIQQNEEGNEKGRIRRKWVPSK